MRPFRAVLPFFLLTALHGAAWSASVWDEAPQDALGVVVVRDLSLADAKVGQLLHALQIPLREPLALVKAATGVDQGLDPHGDLLVVVLPGHGEEARPQLGVWLPLGDYEQLVRSLQGVPRERITAVTIAGEDVLIARHGAWAVVMDPDERECLEQVLDTEPTTSRRLASPSDWNDWITSNDVTAVLSQAGVGRLLSEVFQEGNADKGEDHEASHKGLSHEASDEELFGSPERVADSWQAARAAIRTALDNVPELSRSLLETTAVGCGLRVDAEGNAVMGVRLAWRPDGAQADVVDQAAAAPPLYSGGQFIVAGAGRLSPAWAVAAAGLYAELLARDLGIDVHGQTQRAAVDDFRKLLRQAVEGIEAFAVFSRPGKASDGVYTNSHLVVRVAAAKTFIQRAADVVTRWNGMARHGRDEVRLEFVSEPVQIAGRSATQYSVDMTAAVGGPATTELRLSMERLFGPGGKFRLQLVPVDDRTVLVSAATVEQAAKVVDLIAQGEPVRWDQNELQPTCRLMTADADWRVFFSPHGYVRWLKRQMDAVVGPVLGGPLVKDFPISPPLGVAGGGANDSIWIELVAPAGTIEAFGQFARD